MSLKSPKVAVIMGSDSDFPVLEKGLEIFKEFGIETEVMVCSAHRTPDKAAEFAKNADSNGVDVIVAAAGKAAHLPGVIAAFTVLPVIGIPIKSSFMDGLDSLLSIVQMPVGIPVATVAVDGSENAALLALQIIAVSNKDIKAKLLQFKKELASKVEQKNENLQKKLNDALKNQ